MDNNCTIDDIKMLYIRFATAYSAKFTSSHTSPEIIELWYYDWYQALAGIDRNLIIQSFNECKMESEWPPSIAEIIKKCDEKIGIPNIHDAIKLASSHNFTHPVVKILYERIGSWDFRNDTLKSLLAKAKIYYPQILSAFRSERQRKALCLENKLKEITDASQGREADKRRDAANHNVDRASMRKAQEYLS